MFLLAGGDNLTRSRDLLDLEQVVGQEAELSTAHADPSAERQAADPHGGAGPGWDCDAGSGSELRKQFEAQLEEASFKQAYREAYKEGGGKVDLLLFEKQ